LGSFTPVIATENALVLSFMENLTLISNIFPITVIVAIVLFVVKETFEFFRRKSERGRKSDACKILIAEELSRNAISIKSIKLLFGEIGNDGFRHISYKKAISGQDRIAVVNGVNCYHVPLSPLHTSIFNKVIVDLAAIDASFFMLAKRTYNELAEVNRIREMLINFADDENIKNFSKSISFDFQQKLDVAYTSVEGLYRTCTGDSLESHRLAP
jgi:hypothetical protein